MTDNATLYTPVEEPFTVDEIVNLADGATVTQTGECEIEVAWPDVTVTLNFGMSGDELENHLKGFAGFVTEMAGGVSDDILPLLAEISGMKTVVGCTIEPGFDELEKGRGLLWSLKSAFGAQKKNSGNSGDDRKNKAKSLIVSMACSFEQCLIFAEGNIYSPFWELWFGSDNQDFADLSDLKVCKIRNEAAVATDSQQQRTDRVLQVLATRQVPVYEAHIRWMPDESDVTLRTPQEVARRVIALHGAVCAARGRDLDEVNAELDHAGVMNELTPKELPFVRDEEVDEDDRQAFIWRLECLWVLMWSLGHIDELAWPDSMCDVDGLHDLIDEKTQTPADFIESAQLRTPVEILDTVELTLRLHWALRQSMIEERSIPENLNWAAPTEMVPVQMCPNGGVVAERHYALNWLIRFQDADWDDVDTPT